MDKHQQLKTFAFSGGTVALSVVSSKPNMLIG